MLEDNLDISPKTPDHLKLELKGCNEMMKRSPNMEKSFLKKQEIAQLEKILQDHSVVRRGFEEVLGKRVSAQCHDTLNENLMPEIREEEPENYARVGYLLYDQSAIVTLLLQEVNAFSKKLAKGKVDDRSYKRIVNVLTLFQSVAAYSETARKHLVISLSINVSEIANAISTLTLYDLCFFS